MVLRTSQGDQGSDKTTEEEDKKNKTPLKHDGRNHPKDPHTDICPIQNQICDTDHIPTYIVIIKKNNRIRHQRN